MSEIFAAQITAVANVVLAVFAIVTAVLAGLAFRKQAREVSDQADMLDLQRRQLAEQEKTSAKQAEALELQTRELRESIEDRKREAAEHRRSQAAMVFLVQETYDGRSGLSGGGMRPPDVTVTVVNSSDQPIYGSELRWYRGSEGWGEPNPQKLGMILPGDHIKRSRAFEPGTAMEVCGAALRFTDAAEIRWVRRSNGYLDEDR